VFDPRSTTAALSADSGASLRDPAREGEGIVERAGNGPGDRVHPRSRGSFPLTVGGTAARLKSR